MAKLPQTHVSSRPRFASSPLFVLAAAISAGILAGHYFALQPRSILILTIGVSVGVALLSIALMSRRKPRPASVFLVVAFFLTGLVLSLIENRPIATNRIARIYDSGLIGTGEPVELMGIVQGQPEAAPDSFYLNLRVESIRFRGSERNAKGTVLLLAHTREQKVQEEYDALEFRHGARVRVMTTLDREEKLSQPRHFFFH